MPKRFTKKERALVYAFLVDRDGEKCRLCQQSPLSVTLEIDHINTHKEGTHPDDSPANLQLLCISCNRRKGDPQGVSSVCVLGESPTEKVREALNYQSGSVEMKANDIYERTFIRWLGEYLRGHDSIPRSEARDSGAYMVGCSTATTDRYIAKLTSASGPLEQTRDEMRQWHLRMKVRL